MAIFNPSDFTVTTVGGQRIISVTGGGGGALPWYNVKDPIYGAVGDDATDDYAAFIAARDAIWAAGVAAVLYVPSGIYRLSNFVQLQSAAHRPPIYVLGDWAVLRPTTDTSVFYRKWDDTGVFNSVVQLVIDGFYFLPTTSGQGTGVHTVDSWGTIVRRCHFQDLKIGYHIQSVNSWNEGWVSDDNIFQNCTTSVDFNAPGGTGSFQSGRMRNTAIGAGPGQTGIKIHNSANMYGSHFEFNIWPQGNNAIGIDIDANIHSCKFVGIIDTAGGSGTPLYGIRFGASAINTDHAQFSIDFAGSYTGGDPQTSGVQNASSKTWYYDPLPYGSRQYPRFSLLTTTGDTPYASAANTWARRAIGSAGDISKVSGGLPTWAAPAALTKTDDTNVTATLGGSAATALVNAASITLGWTGTLSQARGGTGSATPFANPSASVGLAAVNGAATTFMRSDAAPALSQSIAPTWTGAHVFANADNRMANLTVGGTGVAPTVELNVVAATAPRIHLQNNTTLFTSTDGFQLAISTVDAYLWNFENGPMHIGTNNLERLTVAAGGTVSVALDSRLIGAVTVGANAGATSGYNLDVQALRARIGSSYTTTTSLDASLFIGGTITNNTTANIGAVHIGATFNGDADSPIGIIVRPFFNPSSPITDAMGGSLAAIHNGGTITNLIGFRPIIASFVSTGAVTNFMAIRVDAPVILGSTKPTNQYGIVVGNQGIATTTKAVGIRVEAQSGSTNNYHFEFGGADTTALGAYRGRIPVLWNGAIGYVPIYA